MRHVPTVVLATLALLVAGCGGGEESSPLPTTRLEIEATDSLRFAPDSFTIPAGVDVSVVLRAGPAVEHDFVVADAAGRGDVGVVGHGPHAGDHHMMDTGSLHVAHADAGMMVTVTMRIDEPGTYEVYCSVPGHRQAGMTGTLEVVAGE